MNKKFAKRILNIFYLFLIVPGMLLAMELSEEDSEESSRLTSKQLREKVKAVKANWWESVEVITPCEEWKRNNKWYTVDDLPPEKKWNDPFKHEIGCFFSTRRKANDLVILEEEPASFLFGAKRSTVMYLKDAAKIMERENDEFDRECEQLIPMIYKRAEEEKKEKEEKSRKYCEQMKLLNYENATYKDLRIDHWDYSSQKESIHPEIWKMLEQADKNKRERERSAQKSTTSQNDTYSESTKKQEQQAHDCEEEKRRRENEHRYRVAEESRRKNAELDAKYEANKRQFEERRRKEQEQQNNYRRTGKWS